jgi:hypothetical protein
MLKLFRQTTILLVLLTVTVVAQEPVDLQIIQEIKLEASKNSKVMETLSYLTDVYGPRLTGSPELKETAEWAKKQLNEWGINNVKLEDWGTFGRGWSVEHISAAMTSPRYVPLIAYPKAWTKSTNGGVSGSPVLVEIESEEELNAFQDSLAGAIVMLGKPRAWEPKFEADAKRHDEEKLAEIASAPELGKKSPWADRRKEWMARRALNRKVTKFLKDEKVSVILQPSEREHGTIRVYSRGGYKLDEEPGLPSIVVSNEQYGRIYRILEKNIPVTLNVDVQNKIFENDTLGFNLIAEIPGTDGSVEDEVVMLGGHLDSWHSGTGATDNAAACAVAMETMRILKKIDVKPRRTIRLALWGGEEQGYLGSRGYLAKHYGDRKTMELKDAHEDFSVYFNLDNGAGKIRGIYLQNNDAARPIFEAWLKPFNDMGANVVTIRNTSGTDHIPFNELGLPGFQFIQDPIDYMTRTHHTNMDVYEHVIPGDVMQASMIMATFVYHAAMRDEKIPRKPLPEPSKK